MTYSAILVGNRDLGGLSPQAVDEAVLAVQGGGADWLAHGLAAEFAVDTEDWSAAERAIRAALGGAPIDVAVLPHDGRRKRLLLADMDSTIIGVECINELADFAGLKAEVAAITERAMRGELDFPAALRHRVGLLKGLPLAALQQTFDQRIRLNPGARALVRTMQANGAVTALVSGGFTFFTKRVAAAAGFASHRANVLLDDGAALMGFVAEPILGREAKLAALLDLRALYGLEASDSLVVGDGANDLAMIQAAGLGVAYRAKPIVADAARARLDHADLTALLYFQGYREKEIVTD